MRRIQSTIIAALLGLFILSVCMPVVSADMGATMSVTNTTGTCGNIVSIPINISDVQNLGALDISLKYNGSVLSPTGFVSTGDLTAGALMMNGNTITKPHPSNWIDATFSDPADNQTVWDYGALANYTGTSDVVNISIVCNATDIGFKGAGSVAAIEFTVIGVGESPLDLVVSAYDVSAPITNQADPTKTDGYECITITTNNATFSAGDGDIYTISLDAGWNMVSIPAIPADASADAIFGDTITQPVYEYDAGYKQVTTLESMKGYWVLANSQVDIGISGTPSSDRDVTVVPGWNMIGPVSSGVQVDSFTDVILPVYGYAAGYNQATTLEQTEGYWLLASAETTITV